MSCTGVTSMGSNVTPITMSLPFGPRPLNSSDIAFELGAVAKITCAPPSFCNASCPELLCQPRLFSPAANGHPFVTNFFGKLNSEVPKTADAQHGNNVAGHRPTVPQRVVSGDSCAEQRRCFGV